MSAGAVEGGRPGVLGLAVDLEDQDVERGEELEHLARDRRGAAHADARAIEPDGRFSLSKTSFFASAYWASQVDRHRLVPGAVLRGARCRSPAPSRGASSSRPSACAILPRDAGVELLPDARHAEEDRRLHLLEVVRHLLDRLGEVDAHAGGDRPVDREHLLGDVRERQVRERRSRSGAMSVSSLRARRGPREVRVREHHALGRAGGARGVDQRREAVGLERVDALEEPLVVDGVALREELLPREHDRIVDACGAAHQHDVLEVRQARCASARSSSTAPRSRRARPATRRGATMYCTSLGEQVV